MKSGLLFVSIIALTLCFIVFVIFMKPFEKDFSRKYSKRKVSWDDIVYIQNSVKDTAPSEKENDFTEVNDDVVDANTSSPLLYKRNVSLFQNGTTRIVTPTLRSLEHSTNNIDISKNEIILNFIVENAFIFS